MRQDLNLMYRDVAEEFARRVTSALGSQIDSVVLFGSAARREAKRSSDIDILVISPDPEAVRDTVSDIRSDLTYERNFSFLISVVHLSQAQCLELVRGGFPFAQDVLAQGVILYDNGTFSRIGEKAVAVS